MGNWTYYYITFIYKLFKCVGVTIVLPSSLSTDSALSNLLLFMCVLRESLILSHFPLHISTTA